MKKNRLTYLIATGCLAFVCSTSSFSGLLSRTYVFEPKKPKLVPNPVFWRLDTRCIISTKDAENKLIGTMKKKSSMNIRGTSLKGSYSVDKYSLSGFGDAYNRMNTLCE